MARQFSSQENYLKLFNRIQQSFNINDLTPQNLSEWLRSDTNPLIDQLASIKYLKESIIDAESIPELTYLSGEIASLPLYKNELNRILMGKREEIEVRLEEERLSEAIFRVQNFAEEKNIVLDETTKGGVYEKWGRWGKPAVVIFSQGKIKSWRYL